MAVGFSSDVIPAAKRMSNVAVIVPKSGSNLWADLWVCLMIFVDIDVYCKDSSLMIFTPLLYFNNQLNKLS